MIKKGSRCEICGSKNNLTRHHVQGGKRKHRRFNPFQAEWNKKEEVTLCRCCHNMVHNPAQQSELFSKLLKKRLDKNEC